MNNLIIKTTEDTPEIKFEPEKNIFEISKRSLPENAIEFYAPVFEWLDNYIKNPNITSVFDFKLEYFNTASAKQIAKILMNLKDLSKKSEVIIRWYYDAEDVDMLITGKRYEKIIGLKFEFITF